MLVPCFICAVQILSGDLSQQSKDPLIESSQYRGEPVSLDLVQVSLIDFFRVVSELSGLNVLVDQDVTGSISVSVEKLPWDQIFQAVLESHGLVGRTEGNLVRISTRETFKREEERRQKQKRGAFLAEGTVTKVRQLNYTQGKTLVQFLGDQVTECGRIDLDEQTNTLIITDIGATADKISALIDVLDVPKRQVEIEARIIEATTNFTRQLGVQFGFLAGGPDDRLRGGLSTLATEDKPIKTANLAFGRVLDTQKLDAVISAAESSGEARILSKPRVSTQDHSEARIVQGAKIPIPVQINFTTNVRYETAALQLTVTPHVTQDDIVALKISVENSVPDFTQTVLGVPTILTSASNTQVLVANGATTVLGGIFVEVRRSEERKVPGLGSIPIVGYLFRFNKGEKETREILFFITPRIKK
jgi:type IV pilus assembly protein PilQ